MQDSPELEILEPAVKKIYSVPELTTQKGAVIPQCTMGYETYGQLNAERSNAILVAHHFSGSSHAAGRFTPNDPVAGFWDEIIGPGKAIDTNRYFVVSTDMLCNVSPYHPMIHTTGPSSINPATGKPWAMDFPIIQVVDTVNMQKQLLESLGIEHLVAVAGPSGGSVQAFQWAASYPDMVDKVIAAVSPGLDMPDYTMAMLHQWTNPVRLDPLWNNGNYYEGSPPTQGLLDAFELIILSAMHFGIFDTMFHRHWADDAKNPLDAFDHEFLVNRYLEDTAKARAEFADANHLLYMVKLCELYDVKPLLSTFTADVLLVPAETDLLMPAWVHKRTKALLEAQGIRVDEYILKGEGGHLDGLIQIHQATDAIRRFLAQ